MEKVYICRFTRDGRALLEHNGVLTNWDKSPVTDAPEFITTDEYLELYPPKTQSAGLWSKEAAMMERENDKHIHGL